MFFGSEFYEEMHGEAIALNTIDPNPGRKTMSCYEVEGRLGRLWNTSQKLKKIVCTVDEILVYSGLSSSSFYHRKTKDCVQSSWIHALRCRGMLIEIEGQKELYEIRGNRKRIDAIQAKSEAGKKGNKVRWDGRKCDPSAIGLRSNDNDNDNDNVNISIPVTKAPAKPRTKKTKEKSKGSLLFNEYREVYLTKYADCPPAGPAEYTQLNRLITKVGFEMAKDLLGFYIVDYKSDYCQKAKHPIGLFTHNFNDIYLKFKEMYPNANYERQQNATVA